MCRMKKSKLPSLTRQWVVIPAAALLLVGCSKKEEPQSGNQKASESTPTPLQKTAADMKESVQQTARDVSQKGGADANKLKTQAHEQIQQVKDQVATEADKLKAQAQQQVQAAKDQSAAASDKLKAQSLIDQASKLVTDSKYADAANVLKQLTNLNLTSEQQKTVDDLSLKIKNALAGDAAKSVGNLLNTNK